MTGNLTPALHAVVAVGLLAAYVALTILGHDGNALLGLLAGQLGGLGLTHLATEAGKQPPPAPPPPTVPPTVPPVPPVAAL